MLDAGSSSIKFSLFWKYNESLMPDVRGQVEGIYTAAHFVFRTPDGALKAEKSWPDGFELGHDRALNHLISTCGRSFRTTNSLASGTGYCTVALPTSSRFA